MTPNRLNEILTTPLSVSDKEIDVLETLTKEFPYFNLPHILLSKLYKEKESYKYDQQLKKASLRTTDRKWLFDYINEGKAKVEAKVEVEVKSRKLTGEVEKVKEGNISEVINQVVPEEIGEAVIEQLNVVETVNEVVDSVVEQPEIQEPITEQLVEEETVKETFNSDVKDTELEEPIANLIVEENKTVNEVITEVFETEKVDTATEDVESRKYSGETLANVDTKLSFTDWLSQMSKPIDHEIKPKKKEHVIEELKEVVSHKKLVEETILSKTAKPLKPTHAKTEESLNIIDAFLKKNPSISQPKTEFFKAEKAAKRSLELEDDIVTETLASIYVKQGHVEQAIWAYEKLILKFPQKEAYFADLLNELKKQKE